VGFAIGGSTRKKKQEIGQCPAEIMVKHVSFRGEDGEESPPTESPRVRGILFTASQDDSMSVRERRERWHIIR